MVLVTAGAIVLLLVPLPRLGRAGEALTNLLHAPLFAGLTLVFLATCSRLEFSRATAAIAAVVAALLLGGITEFAQTLVERQAEWLDMAANACGIAAALFWFESRRSSRRAARAAGILLALTLLIVPGWRPAEVLLDAAVQPRELPLLATFETNHEMTRWAGYEAKIRRTREYATQGDWSLRVDLEPGQYPSAAMRWPIPDWSAYDCLSFDIAAAAGSPPLDVIVKVQDALHDGDYKDRFHQTVQLQPGQQQHVEVDLSDVAAAPATRLLDLRRVSLLQFFVVRPGADSKFYLDNIRLGDCEEMPSAGGRR